MNGDRLPPPQPRRPVAPPPGSGAPPYLPPPSAPPRPSRHRRWIVLGVLLLLVLGGCGVLATYAGARFSRAVTAPVDTANDYLDAARADGDLAAHTCEGAPDPPAEVASSQRQYLTSSHITNRDGAVSGSLTLEDGTETTIELRVRRAGDGWCVTDVRL